MVLLGRERERAICLTTLMDDPAPAGVVIVGQPGIGKTTLLRSAVRDVTASGRRVLHTTGLSGEVDVPFANLADLLDRAAQEVLPELPAVQANVLGGVLRLGRLPGQLDDGVISRAIVNALRALARRCPVVVAIDDSQWLDADTQRLLRMAAAWITDVPLAWLLSVRASQERTGLAHVALHEFAARSVRIDLGPLDGGSLTSLVVDRVPGPWSPVLVRRIIALSSGNPYTAIELARETVAAAGFHASEATVPASLSNSLKARLHRLDQPVQRAVQAVALVARPSRGLLRSLAAGETDNTDIAVDAAIDAGVLQVVSENGVLGCSHPLLQQVAISTMDTRRRRLLHRRLAAVIEDRDEAALHLAAGTDEPDEGAASTLEAAAVRLMETGMPARASGLAEAAVRLTPGAPNFDMWRRRLLVLRSLEAAHDIPRGETLVASWSRETPPPDLRGFFSLIYSSFSDMQTRFQLVVRAVGELAGNPSGAAYAGARLARCLVDEDWRVEEARGHAEQAVLAARACGEPGILSWALSVLADVLGREGDPDAGRRMRAAVSMQDEHGLPLPWMAPHTALIDWHLRRGELAPARELVDVLYEANERSGRWGGAVRWCLMQIAWASGRWEAAEEHADHYVQHARFSDSNATASTMATCLVRAGLLPAPQMRDELVESIHFAESRQDRVAATFLRGIAAEFELSVDDPAAAAAWLAPVADLLRDRTFVEFLLPTFEGDLIESWLRLDRHDEAVERLQLLRESAERRDEPWAKIVGLRCAGLRLLSEGEPGAAAGALERATAGARELGLQLELGRGLLVLGRADRRARRRRGAATVLDEAIAIFEGLGARHWLGQARAERARLEHAAPELLTATERRIAELVASGHSNAEIAAALQVKEKTVEANLTRIYRKLGVRNRVHLARAAAAGYNGQQRFRRA
ncbi:AAA family ATPase [Actinoplanes sp. CA-142083]|uniref:helix-turn-helix transcriptional regulator n=1 Tax=Actinoplanes sp. CA-142083 TaxID=3239903 RepID=UPI003D8FF03A